jgi:multidrug efflux pump subunit AcrA (membrane-fusion protein)
MRSCSRRANPQDSRNLKSRRATPTGQLSSPTPNRASPAPRASAKQLLPPSDLDAAKIAVDTAEASLASQQATVAQTQAAINQSQATVNQNQVNLDHTIIEAPIDGIIIQRSVDVGQTVAASMQAPTLFIIAADLTKMQVNANIDEADVGRIRPGQHVTFKVDAYPTDTFEGTVSQIRLQPVVVQNVTTYGTVIDVPNAQLKLKPGMTANVKVEIAKKSDALRVPNAALRFRPSTDVFAALNQPVPPEALSTGGRGGRAGQGRGGSRGAADATTPALGAQRRRLQRALPTGFGACGRAHRTRIRTAGADPDRVGAIVALRQAQGGRRAKGRRGSIRRACWSGSRGCRPTTRRRSSPG